MIELQSFLFWLEDDMFCITKIYCLLDYDRSIINLYGESLR